MCFLHAKAATAFSAS